MQDRARPCHTARETILTVVKEFFPTCLISHEGYQNRIIIIIIVTIRLNSFLFFFLEGAGVGVNFKLSRLSQ